MTNEFVTVTRLGETFGLSHRQVRSYLAEAQVPMDSKGRYERIRAEHILRLRKDDSRSVDRAANGQSNTLTTAQAQRAESLAEIADAKQVTEIERARRLKLQNDRLEGELIPRAIVAETGKSFVVKARTALLAVADKVAPRIIGLEDVPAIAAAIQQEIQTALGALADEDAFVLGVIGS